MTGIFAGWDATRARAFTDQWMPAWTGNDPDRLVAFYTAEAFYRDPGVPDGLRGRDELHRYFAKLLARFPTWVWTTIATTPLEGGFLNHWQVSIPFGADRLDEPGVCTVIFDGDGRIARNEVHFDRSRLLDRLREPKR